MIRAATQIPFQSVLEDLDMYDCSSLSDRSFEIVLPFFSKLRKLKLGCGATCETVRTISSNCLELESLTILGTFSDSDLEPLSNLRRLAHLNLDFNETLTLQVLSILKRIPELDTLSLEMCDFRDEAYEIAEGGQLRFQILPRNRLSGIDDSRFQNFVQGNWVQNFQRCFGRRRDISEIFHVM